MPKEQKFSATCPSRVLFAEVSDKWSMMILTVLSEHPRRFNEIRRLLEGVSQKSLSQTLRKLERNGIVSRQVLDTSPVAVEYALTAIGRSLIGPFRALYGWTVDYLDQVEAARQAYDARNAGAPARRAQPVS